MNDQIEGQPVDPHLLTIIEKPHLVPVRMMPFQHGVGNPDIIGYADGYINAFNSTHIIRRIHALITDLLDKEVGNTLPSNDRRIVLARKIEAFGRDVCLFRGIKSNPGILMDECKALARGEDGNTYYDRLAVASEGYRFTDEHMSKRREEGSLPLDTDGQWLKDLLGEKVEGDEMIAMEQEQDGKIILAPYTDENRDNTQIRGGFFTYNDRFLKVANLTKIRHPDTREFETQMAIILRVHNILYAIHRTLIGDKGARDLPGGIDRIWELPRAS